MLGYLILGLQPVPVALLSRGGVSPSEAVFVRFVLSAIFIFAVCFRQRHLLRTSQPIVLVLRGVLGAAAVLLYFTSIKYTGAARGTLLNYTYPIWANVFAWFLGARTGRNSWFALALALVGVWFVVAPKGGIGPAQLSQGDVAGLLSAVLGGAAVVAVKKLRETDDALVIIASFTGFGMLMSLPFCTMQGLTLSFSRALIGPTLAVGVLSFVGHYYFTRGYRGVSVATATLLSLLVPFVATLTGVFFLDEPLTARFMLGTSLVFGAFVFSFKIGNDKLKPTAEARPRSPPQ